MALSVAKPAWGWTLDTGATYCPDYLFMLDNPAANQLTGTTKSISGCIYTTTGYDTTPRTQLTTSAAHGLAVGDIVKFSGMPGDFGTALNGKQYSVWYVHSSTEFSIHVTTSSGYTTYTSGGTIETVTPFTSVGKAGSPLNAGLSCADYTSGSPTGGVMPTLETYSGQSSIFFGTGNVTSGGRLWIGSLGALTTGYTVVIIGAADSGTRPSQALFSTSTRRTGYLFDHFWMDASTSSRHLRLVNNNTNNINMTSSQDHTADTIQMMAGKLKVSQLGVSLDGAAWTTVADGPTTWPTQAETRNCMAIAGAADSSTDLCTNNFHLLAAAIYSNLDASDAQISAIFNSGDPWTAFGLASTPKGRMMLNNYVGVEGVTLIQGV